MQIYIVKKSVGQYDAHRIVDVKGFLVKEDAEALVIELKAKHTEMLKLLERVANWYTKWEKVNPTPQPSYPYQGFHLTEEQEAENEAAYVAHGKAYEEHCARWYKSYCAYAKLHGFEAQPATESSLIRGYEDDRNCLGGFFVTELEVA